MNLTNRIQFLAGRFEKSANEFYAAYRKNEEAIDTLPLKAMSRMTEKSTMWCDYEKQQKNVKIILDFAQHLKNVNRFG